MKKLILLFFFAIILASFIYATECSTNPADYIFYDDGETGNTPTANGWQIATGTGVNYTTQVAYEGTKSLGIQAVTYINHSGDFMHDGYQLMVKYYVNVTPTSNGQGFELYSGAYNNRLAGLSFNQGISATNLLWNDGSWHDSSIVAGHTWHNMTWNITGGKTNFYIDGVYQGQMATPSANGIVLEASGGTANYDNIMVFNGSKCPAPAPTAPIIPTVMNSTYLNHPVNFTSEGGAVCGFNTTSQYTNCPPDKRLNPYFQIHD